MPSLPLGFRTGLYITALVFSFLTVGLAAGSIALSIDDFNDYIQPAAELMAAGGLALIVLPVLHFGFHMRTTDSWLGAVWLEFVVLGILWPLFFGGAAALTTFNAQLADLQQLEDRLLATDAFVPLTYAAEAFGFLAWLATMALFILVLVLAFVNQHRGERRVWTHQLRASSGLPLAGTADKRSINPTSSPHETRVNIGTPSSNS